MTKSEPQHIGQSARETSRRKRLSEIETKLSQHRDLQKKFQTEKGRRRTRQQVAASESQRLPTTALFAMLWPAIIQAALALDEARQRLAEAETRVALRRGEHKTLSDKRDAVAVDLKLDRLGRKSGRLRNQGA